MASRRRLTEIEASESALDTRRELIYVSERIKAIALERAMLREEVESMPEGDTLEDEARRRRIYVVDHLKVINAEYASKVARRAELVGD